jgi:hypothetical protein
MTGPVPKRQAERRRRNTTTESGASNAVETVVVSHEMLEDPYLVSAPAPNPEWHPLAMQAYWAARTSAIREWMEPSDWSALFVTLEQLSRWLNPQEVMIQQGPEAGTIVEMTVPMPGGVLTAIMKSLSELMFTEGSRRKLRIEVERQKGAIQQQVAAPTGDNVIEIRRDRLDRPNQRGSA